MDFHPDSLCSDWGRGGRETECFFPCFSSKTMGIRCLAKFSIQLPVVGEPLGNQESETNHQQHGHNQVTGRKKL